MTTAILLSQTVYPVEVRGSMDAVVLLCPALGAHVTVLSGSIDDAIGRLKTMVQPNVDLSVDPVEWRRSHPGTHWYVKASRARIEIVREEWGEGGASGASGASG